MVGGWICRTGVQSDLEGWWDVSPLCSVDGKRESSRRQKRLMRVRCRGALFRGLGPSLLRAVPAAASTFVGFELTRGGFRAWERLHDRADDGIDLEYFVKHGFL